MPQEVAQRVAALAEGSGENLFMVKNGVVKTTPLTSVLNGITRQTVLDYFKHAEIPIAGDRFTRDELYCADEAFMTGTAAEITPIQSLDTRIIGAGKPGPITKKLQEDYQKIVRGELKLPEKVLTLAQKALKSPQKHLLAKQRQNNSLIT